MRSVLHQFMMVLLLIPAYSGFCQSSIATERPTQSIGSSVLPANSFQFEQGFSYIKDTLVLDGFFRLAVSQIGEIRVLTFYDSPDVIFGAKVNLLKVKGFRPGLALKVDISNDFEFTDYRLTVEQAVSDKLSIAVNLGSDHHFYSIVVFSYSITNRLGTYLEAFFQDDFQQYNTGLTFQIDSETQIDINTGLIDYDIGYIGVGIARRLIASGDKTDR